MNTAQAPHWLPSFLVPFVTLSYPTSPPSHPDSFPNSHYYKTGLLDGCIIITCIAVMAVLRDATRLGIMEPYARWYLTRKLVRNQKKAYQNGVANGNGVSNGHNNCHAIGNGCTDGTGNGHANGNANGHSYPSEKQSELARKRRKEERIIHRSVLRFAEQGWSVIYYTIQWSFGLYIHCNLPTYPFESTKLWVGYPHFPLSAPLKFYYLCQTSFYLHQILILNAEARRKDHVQMMAHHFITIALIVASYFYNCTRVGCLIMVLMDWCDIFLPLAKMYRYLSLPTLCDATFVWFLISWFVTRHVLFVTVIWGAYTDTPRLMPYAWEPERGRYLTYETWIAFMILLVALQILQMIWFWMICRVAWRVISGQGAEDTRSDDEASSSEGAGDSNDRPIPPGSDLKKRRR